MVKSVGSFYSESSGISIASSNYEDDSSSYTDNISLVSNRDEIAQKENKSVLRWKFGVGSMLIISAILVISFAYIFLTSEENMQFKNQFHQDAERIRESVHYRMRNTIESFDTISDTITSFTETSKLTWPFVTVPHVEMRFEHARKYSLAEILMFAPMVNSSDQIYWEKYSVREQNWIEESLKDYQRRRNNNDTIRPNLIKDFIYAIGDNKIIQETSGGPYAPIWQIAPPPLNTSIINFDLLSDKKFKSLAENMESNDGAVLSDLWDTTFYSDHLIYLDSDENNDLIDAYDFDIEGNNRNHNHRNLFNNRRKLKSTTDSVADQEPKNSTEQHSSYADIEIKVQISGANHYFQRTDINKTLENATEQNTDHLNFYDTDEAINRSNITLRQQMHHTNSTRNKLYPQLQVLNSDSPRSLILQPVYESHNNLDRKLVGILVGVIPWESYLTDINLKKYGRITCVFKNSCGEVFSFELEGNSLKYLGLTDRHDPKFQSFGEQTRTYFGEFHASVFHCHYDLSIYPTKSFEKTFITLTPVTLTSAISLFFMVVLLVFYAFVNLVDRRQSKVMNTAVRANAIVSSLFPLSVRARIMEDADEKKKDTADTRKPGFFAEAPKRRLKSFLNDNEEKSEGDDFAFNTKPIADLFPEATVLFADIVGFTAWSSVREPTQVFQLLETIYHSFDQIAKRRRVFKVETIGDCYVAVTGLPDPNPVHAIVMARFARDCKHIMHDLTKKMERTLGPDTGDLSMRFGLHSGPVTAGVLRGEKSRFQLFGDTVNTAARMESNGARDRIHISQQTADLLVGAGKSKWVIPREGTIQAKGKGELQTFWLQVIGDDSNSNPMTSSDDGSIPKSGDKYHAMGSNSLHSQSNNINNSELTPKMQRLIDWNVDQLSRLLKAVMARRKALFRAKNPKNMLHDHVVERNGTVLEEVKEIITLPNFEANQFRKIEDPDSIEISDEVTKQLHDYVTKICTLYRNNPFHNFEHASHVTMSVAKLLSRIVAPDDVKCNDEGSTSRNATDKFASALHDHTYGITSDPLTQFACTFSALIHDVDHTGVPNTQLVMECTTLASRYKNKSVAEQNSVDLAWDLLMDVKYINLRRVIYASESELYRFRQLVVNAVMATDIVDKELRKLRDGRWEKAFNEKTPTDLDEDRNRKATIVIEHLIQASDVAHTMQHWHVYRKWNERLFREMYLAYRAGRAEEDPSTFWYKSEIGFYDFYIIPLAKKLKDCGVFGVTSDEYLDYAMKNREEWKVKGEEIVKSMLQKMNEDDIFIGNNNITHTLSQDKITEESKSENFRQEFDGRDNDERDSSVRENVGRDFLEREDVGGEVGRKAPNVRSLTKKLSSFRSKRL